VSTQSLELTLTHVSAWNEVASRGSVEMEPPKIVIELFSATPSAGAVRGSQVSVELDGRILAQVRPLSQDDQTSPSAVRLPSFVKADPAAIMRAPLGVGAAANAQRGCQGAAATIRSHEAAPSWLHQTSFLGDIVPSIA